MTTGTEATARANQGCPAEAGRYRRNDSRLAFILREELWGRFDGAGSKGARGCTIVFSLLRGMVTGDDSGTEDVAGPADCGTFRDRGADYSGADGRIHRGGNGGGGGGGGRVGVAPLRAAERGADPRGSGNDSAADETADQSEFLLPHAAAGGRCARRGVETAPTALLRGAGARSKRVGGGREPRAFRREGVRAGGRAAPGGGQLSFWPAGGEAAAPSPRCGDEDYCVGHFGG